MSKAAKLTVCIAALASALTATTGARAQCCPGFTQQCAGTKSRWCVQNGAPQGTLPSAFCPYGDQVVSELEMLFAIPAPGTFEFDVEWPTNGGAHTGTDCNNFGNGVTGDAFTNVNYGVNGFYGYLLSLHEAINVWTGLSSNGWPTDFWADHVSAFPNEMDYRIMGTLGAMLNDPNLSKASAAQKMRFWPGGDSADPRVVMFDNVFVLPKMNGYAGYSHMFALQRADQVSWDDVATSGNNPDERRTEYVAAYMSLAAGQSVLPIMTAANVCNGTDDGAQEGDVPYSCKESNIDAIATAHCAIAANGEPASDLTAFRSGNYAQVASGPCGATCPSECGCRLSTMTCVAPWLADVPSDAGGPEGGANAEGGAAQEEGGTSGSPAGDSGDDGSGTGESGGSAGSGAGSGAAGGGDAAPPLSGSGGGANGASPGSGSSSSGGCSCRTLGGAPDYPASFGGIALSALGVLPLVRSRLRRR